MKILFISNLYPPNVVGGYERLCFDVASALAEKGHDVSVLTSSYGRKQEVYPDQVVDRSLKLMADDADIYKTFNASQNEIDEFSKNNNKLVEQKIISQDPDIVFVWNLFFLNSSIIEAIRRSEKKTVFLLTDNWLISFLNPSFWSDYFTSRVLASPALVQRIKSGIRTFFSGGNRKKIFLEGKAVFPSIFMRDLYFKAGFSFTDHVIVPHGVNLISRTDEDYADRSVLKDPGRLKLLFAGRIVQIKGVHTIIQALPGIIESLPETRVHLTILGDCSDSGYLERMNKMVSEKGLAETVTFIPPVKECRLFSLFQEHDIYLFPSLYEPFSLTLIHALQSGIPTIASDTGGNREIVSHGKNGILFRTEDCGQLTSMVVKLAKSSELRERISVKARDVGEYYTFDRMVDQIENYLKG